jgi:uncharacterized protein DUF2597
MGKRISGKNMSFTMEPSGIEVEVEEVSLSIEDSSGAAMDGGRPNGYLDGEVKASGDITVDLENYALINNAAAEAGSFSDLPVQDFLWFGNVEGVEEKVEAFGNKLKLAEVVNYKPAGSEKLLRKIPYEVTGQDFVKINGVPYLPPPGE